jgi:hypothetical protein
MLKITTLAPVDATNTGEVVSRAQTAVANFAFANSNRIRRPTGGGRGRGKGEKGRALIEVFKGPY